MPAADVVGEGDLLLSNRGGLLNGLLRGLLSVASVPSPHGYWRCYRAAGYMGWW